MTQEQAAAKRALLDTGLMGYLDGASVFPIAFRPNSDGKLDKVPLVKYSTAAKPLDQWADNEIPSQTMGWGIACGPSGLVVLDGDRDGALEDIGVRLPDTYAVKTGRPTGVGRHLYFRAPANVRLKNAVAAFPGVDVRAAGGYVVAPGAVRPDGGRYEIAREAPIAAMPDVLARALPSKPERDAEAAQNTEQRVDSIAAYCAAALRNELGPLEDFGVAEGGRNDALNRAAFALGQLVGDPDDGYLDEAEVRARLADWAGDAGLDPAEVSATVESGLSKGKAEPRHLVEEPASEDADGPVVPNPASVRRELQRLTDRAEAVRQLAAAERQLLAAPMPPVVKLTDLLAAPVEPTAYRVAGLWPVDGRVLLAAPDKAGKTTLMGNLVRCLVDGDPFLGRFAVDAVGRVALLDDEMGGQLNGWLRDQGIRNTDAVDVVDLQGALSSFDVLTPEVRALWAERLRGTDVLILDCLAPVLNALGLAEANEAGRFLVALDELVRAAGIREVLLVHHFGHQNERARGDSRLLGWPTAKWTIVKELDGFGQPLDHGLRYFASYGRDVDLPESQLDYDPATRRLTLVGGSRSQTKTDAAREAVLEVVSANPGMTQNAILSMVGGNKAKVKQAIGDLARDGRLRREPGANRASLHYVVDAAGSAVDDFLDDLLDE